MHPQTKYKSMKSLSIVIPVYNVENYIRANMESIFRQGLSDDCFEVIIIDDGTNDRSIEVISDIIELHPNITVVKQENQGLSVARNNGIALATGEYILMPDSDDLLVFDSLPPLLHAALESKADLVVADFLETNDAETVIMQEVPQTEFTFKEKTGKQLFLEDLNPYESYVWRTLFKREFLLKHQMTFFPGICFQDVPFTNECYIRAEKCLRTSWLLNIYRKREGSATYSFSKKKAIDMCIVIGKTWQLRHINGLTSPIIQKLEDNVYATFSVLFYSMMHSIKSHQERIEIVRRLNQEVPDLLFSKNLKRKAESLMVRRLPRAYLLVRDLHWKWIRHSRVEF